MTRKDYIRIAQLFNEVKPSDPPSNSTESQHHDELLLGIVTILRDDNPRFDAHRFIVAAGGYCTAERGKSAAIR